MMSNSKPAYVHASTNVIHIQKRTRIEVEDIIASFSGTRAWE